VAKPKHQLYIFSGLSEKNGRFKIFWLFLKISQIWEFLLIGPSPDIAPAPDWEFSFLKWFMSGLSVQNTKLGRYSDLLFKPPTIIWCDSQSIFLVFFQLQNIQHHIGLTKEHIDKLNERFADYQHPPKIFLTVRYYTTKKISLHYRTTFPGDQTHPGHAQIVLNCTAILWSLGWSSGIVRPPAEVCPRFD
jgi:hypothetical protein